MAQTLMLGNGKIAKLPGAYATLKAEITSPTPMASYNNVLLIDAGAGAGFTSVPGVIKDGASVKGNIISCDEELANYYIKGGALAPVVEAFYHPARGRAGIGQLFYCKAATTTPAKAATNIPATETEPAKLGLFEGAITCTNLQTVEEGPVCNTTMVGGKLTRGFVVKTIWKETQRKAYIEIFQGTYQGTNLQGELIGNKLEADTTPVLIYRSKKCSTPQELVDFLKMSLEFKAILKIDGLVAVKQAFVFETSGDKSVDVTLSGGTETYATDLTNTGVLASTIDIDYSVMMVMDGTLDNQPFTTEVLSYITTEAKGIKMMATYKSDREVANAVAASLNSDACIMIAGQSKKLSILADSGFIVEDTMVNAARVIGRIFGLSPEIPGTLKDIGIDGMVEEYSDANLETMLEYGVIAPYFDADLQKWVISQAVNTLQQNDQLINEEDCSTYSVQAKRILQIVVKNLVQQSKKDFWSNDTPTNRATLSNAYVKSWTEVLLGRMTYSTNKQDDNYLISYEVVKVEDYKDAKRVYLKIAVNSEVTKILFLITVLGD